ncbi:TetR/AcrR family transcriptional regulator [Tsukamurella pseudospumae]|uniref:HTH tetR-type domain-containing protein n=1 Tax=Tsukamurella pseudospumae TaxID=239498 RepID=A0A137YU02_9ACTN|nr:TetR/AcrR family transcriptional regulator [Tsukamurella pseudospumae]KXO89464.1 hypothetical protein AXK61_08420 [Tsukamurella pseudospumae]
MSTPPPPRRGRPALGAPRLTRDVIVRIALGQIDEHGIAATGMRSVAKQLGVDPKSLYNHVRDKEDLMDAVADAILTSIDAHVPTGDLDADLAGIAYAFRAAALAHPRAAPLVLTRPPHTLAAFAPAESILHVLLTAGFGPGEAVHMMRSLLALLIGTLQRELETGTDYDEAAIASREAAFGGSGWPAVQAVAGDLARFDPEAEFEYMIALSIGAVRGRMPEAR